MPTFSASRKKIERADKHIKDVTMVLRQFSDGDIHTLVVKHDSHTGKNFVQVDFLEEEFPVIDCALIIGDAIHNLRSALDFMWYEFVANPSEYTSFPIRDTRKELEATLNGALKKKQIASSDRDFVVDKIQPYKAGNRLLWALHDMDVRDKHHLFIPVLKFMVIRDIHLEDENGRKLGLHGIAHFTPVRHELFDAIGVKVTVKSKGRPSAQIFFGGDTTLYDESIIPTLYQITKEVTRTIRAFELHRP